MLFALFTFVKIRINSPMYLIHLNICKAIEMCLQYSTVRGESHFIQKTCK